MKKSVYDFSAAKKISLKEYTVTAESDDRAFTDQSAKNSANKTLYYSETGFVCPNDITIKRTYFAGGRVFAYCSDNLVYECVSGEVSGTGGNSGDSGAGAGNSFIKAVSATFLKEPLIIPVTDCGEEKIIVSGEEGAYLLYFDKETGERKSVSADIPYGTDFAICDGRLFIANGKNLYFSEEYDCLNFSVGTENEGIIKTDGSDGGIVALQTAGDELYILCKRRILVLTPKGDIAEWTLKKENTRSFSVDDGYGAGCGSNLVFRAEKRFYVYNGKTLKVAKSKLNDRFAIYYDKAVSALGALVCRAFIDDGEKIYVYDPETEEEFILPRYCGVSKTGGYATDAQGKKIYKLTSGLTSDGYGGAPASAGGSPSAVNRLGGNYDFGNCKRKTLVKVAIKAKGAGTVKIRGDSAVKSYDVANGYTEINVGITSRRLRLEFSSSKAAAFEPQKITFVYFES